MKKKIIGLSVASMLSTTFFMGVGVPSVNASEINNSNQDYTEISDEVQVGSRATVPWATVLKYFYKGAWYGLNKVTNNYYSIKPSASGTSSSISLTPGTIAYNTGSNGGISQIDFKVAGTSGSVVVYANTDALGTVTLKKINLSISKGSSLKASKSANAGQWLIHRPSSTGNYYARYTTTEKRKWTPYIIYNTSITHGLGVGGSKSLVEKETIETNLVSTEIGNYIKPSREHYEGFAFDLSDVLTLKELDNEFYDETLQTSVYSMKHFSVGDVVKVRDTITKVTYNSETDESELYFETREEPLQFKGNLVGKYKEGDNLNLTFKVKSLDEKYNLYAIDYLADYLITSEIPSIEDFNPYVD